MRAEISKDALYKSLTYLGKRKGPRIEPCGTPQGCFPIITIYRGWLTKGNRKKKSFSVVWIAKNRSFWFSIILAEFGWTYAHVYVRIRHPLATSIPRAWQNFIFVKMVIIFNLDPRTSFLAMIKSVLTHEKKWPWHRSVTWLHTLDIYLASIRSINSV